MAKKSKKKPASKDMPDVVDEANPTEELIEDAVEIVEEEVAEAEPAEDVVDTDIDDAELISEPQTDEVVEDLIQESVESDAVQAQTVVESRGPGFFPLLLGGLVAGGIGYGISYFQWANSSDLEAQISQQADAIAALQENVSQLPPPADLAPLEGMIGEVTSSVESVQGGVDELGSQLTTAVERIDALERRPNADGTLADTAMAAFEADIQVLRDQLVEQQAEMTAMATSAADQLQATRNEALAIEENAVATARKATARTVLAEIQNATNTGAPIGALLSDLGGALEGDVPAALTDVAEGIPTLASLQSAFPDQARAALSVARSEGVSGEDTSGFSSFLRNQFDVRSTARQEGDSADAILSRAEDSLKTGQLNDALAEIAGLPEVVRGALSDWVGEAERRASALDAISQLSDTLNIN